MENLVPIFPRQNISRIPRKAELKNMQELLLKIFTDLLFIIVNEVFIWHPLGAYAHAGNSKDDSNASF